MAVSSRESVLIGREAGGFSGKMGDGVKTSSSRGGHGWPAQKNWRPSSGEKKEEEEGTNRRSGGSVISGERRKNCLNGGVGGGDPPKKNIEGKKTM